MAELSIQPEPEPEPESEHGHEPEHNIPTSFAGKGVVAIVLYDYEVCIFYLVVNRDLTVSSLGNGR